jgi:hypothetical protein
MCWEMKIFYEENLIYDFYCVVQQKNIMKIFFSGVTRYTQINLRPLSILSIFIFTHLMNSARYMKIHFGTGHPTQMFNLETGYYTEVNNGHVFQ